MMAWQMARRVSRAWYVVAAVGCVGLWLFHFRFPAVIWLLSMVPGAVFGIMSQAMRREVELPERVLREARKVLDTRAQALERVRQEIKRVQALRDEPRA